MPIFRNSLATSVASFCLLFAACESNQMDLTGPVAPSDASTWQTVQRRILEPSCASVCHRAGTSFAEQSGLILTADVAYGQLAEVAPKNEAARSDGLLRVRTEPGTDAQASLLWEKIDAPNQDHFYEDHPLYGAIMPLGGDYLTFGELEYVRQWLQAGAPETGEVADRDLLTNTERYEAGAFTPLTQPASGLALRLGPFDVAPNFEREFFYYEPLNQPQDLFINRIEISMRSGSHHFILYTLRDDTPVEFFPGAETYREIRFPNGTLDISTIQTMAYQEFFAGTQWPRMDYHFPAGIALRFPAGKGLDLNSHSVNRTGDVRTGEIHVNLHTVDPATIEHTAEILVLNNTGFSLPPGKVTTVSHTYRFGSRMHVFQLFSHAHEHLTEFRVEIAGGPGEGRTLYRTFDWEHPPILELNPPLTLEPGQGLRIIATYNNWTDRTLRFGLQSVDEMMILFGYYYTD